MKKIGITGNIASGKSAVETIIKSCGYKVIDADFICHGAMKNPEIISKIKKVFEGFEIITPLGELDRRKIGAIVFDNYNLKGELEGILHPEVKKELEKFYEKNKNETIVFASIPLLFEAKMEKNFEKIILITADEKVRLERLVIRNSFNKNEAQKRLNSQISQEEKLEKSDFIIENNSSLEELEIKVKEVLKLLH